MPPRSRARRSAAAVEENAEPSTPSRRSGRGGRAVKEEEPDTQVVLEEEDDAEGEEVDENDAAEDNDEVPEAGPSRRAPRSSAKPKGRARGRGRRDVGEPQDDEALTDGDATQEAGTPLTDGPGTPRKRVRKSVSYKEIPPNSDMDEEEDAEGEEDITMDAEGEDDVDAEGEVDDTEAEATVKEKPAKPTFEKVGSGRGGFSVKGAAAAAARARWDKVRRERAERGDDSDDDRPRRKAGGGGGASGTMRNKKASDETPATGATVMVKNKEYIMGEDELILPDNEKGDTKIDADGHLQGGREWKMYTYTSIDRPNPNKRYALTIDVARACGYTDSLAFLRRVPQIIKLSCFPSERDLLIEKGKVTGNLKHRMVTMVAVRNIYKLLGAKVIKDGRWVTDDYDEEDAMAKCQAMGVPPGSIVLEEEIQPYHPPPPVTRSDAAARAANLIPFYAVGGPTTHFGGNGANPVYDGAWSHKRAKLRTMGITEEDWMFKTAEETRRVDRQLKEFREDRIIPLEGDDLKCWVYTLENQTDPAEDGAKEEKISTTTMNRKREMASMAPMLKEDQEGLAPLPSNVEGDISMEVEVDDGVERTEGGKIIVETEEDSARNAAKSNWGLGSWRPGVVKAAYEPHTHTPHVPLYTQPAAASRDRLSLYPLLASYSDSKHKNFVQSSLTGPAARGLASVEYVLETKSYTPQRPSDGVWTLDQSDINVEDRLRSISEAEEWEKIGRKKQRSAAANRASAVPQTPAS